MQLPMPGLQVLQPRSNPALGSVLVRPNLKPTDLDWEDYQSLLADRARWLIKENGGDASPLGERLFEAGLLPWETSDPEEALAALESPDSRAHLRNLGLDLPLRRPKDQAQALARVQETPLEEWAAMLVSSER